MNSKDQIELKQVGVFVPTLSATEQELLSIYQDLMLKIPRDHQASLRVVLYHLDESIRLLTKLSEEVVDSKTVQ
jgi:hypothetical protein